MMSHQKVNVSLSTFQITIKCTLTGIDGGKSYCVHGLMELMNDCGLHFQASTLPRDAEHNEHVC